MRASHLRSVTNLEPPVNACDNAYVTVRPGRQPAESPSVVALTGEVEQPPFALLHASGNIAFGVEPKRLCP